MNTDFSHELWRPVTGYEGLYEVSNLGRVRSLASQRLLSQTRAWFGHRRVCLCRKGDEKTPFVHRLVLAAFRGECPTGMQAAHLDGIPDHNILSNLTWATPKENNSHKKLHGTWQIGDTSSRHTLTAVAVREIRARRAKGETLESIGRDYGVQKAAIHKVISGYTWSHVS